MILQTIFIVFGLVMFINAIFEKWNIWDDIAKIGSNTSSEFIFNLTACRFCVLFWITWIVAVPVAILNDLTWSFFIVPFVVGGFVHLIGKQ